MMVSIHYHEFELLHKNAKCIQVSIKNKLYLPTLVRISWAEVISSVSRRYRHLFFKA